MSASQVGVALPSAMDESGYTLTSSDFEFMRVDPSDAWRCARQEGPLGMTAALYERFVDTLRAALSAEGLADADVRLQGSSARFFSSPAKPFPASKPDLARQYMSEHGRIWSKADGDAIFAAYELQWPAIRPAQRPWDALYQLRVSPDPSDVDIQVASQLATDAVTEQLTARGIDVNEFPIENETYRFIWKQISDHLFLKLKTWADNWTDELDREVSVAVFGSNGPPVSAHPASSHFRESDWILVERSER